MPRDIDPVDVRVGQRIRAYRLDRRMSQSALGNKIGVSFQQIQKYERGINRIGIARLKKIAAVFDAPLNAFIDEGEGTGGNVIDSLVAGALARPYAMRMLWAFDAIDDANKRHALVHFVESMAQEDK
jgi:transcriptional regulator with XRE-family HTH domain